LEGPQRTFLSVRDKSDTRQLLYLAKGEWVPPKSAGEVRDLEVDFQALDCVIRETRCGTTYGASLRVALGDEEVTVTPARSARAPGFVAFASWTAHIEPSTDPECVGRASDTAHYYVLADSVIIHHDSQDHR
jgi:hypothetical protein